MSEPQMTTDVAGICRYCRCYVKWTPRPTPGSQTLVDMNGYHCWENPASLDSSHWLMIVDLADPENVEAFLADPVRHPYEAPF